MHPNNQSFANYEDYRKAMSEYEVKQNKKHVAKCLREIDYILWLDNNAEHANVLKLHGGSHA